MLCFVIDDIYNNKDHTFAEYEEDQSAFEAVWQSFTKESHPVKEEDAVFFNLAAVSMQQKYDPMKMQYEERVSFEVIKPYFIKTALYDGCV